MLRHLLLPVVLWLAATPLAAQTDTAPAQPTGAPVIARKDTLFYIHGDLGPFTPAERAAALSRRIEDLARDPLAKGADVRVVDTAGVTDIRLGDVVVMTVTERDAVESGFPRIQVAQQYALRIQEAVRAGEAGASLKSILLGVVWTILATAVLVVLFRIFNWVFPRLYQKLESWRGTRIPSLRIQRLELLSANRLTDTLIGTARILRIVAVVFVLYIYLPLVLSFFPWTRDLSDRLFRYVIDPAGNAWSAFVAYLPSLFAVVVIVVIFRYVLKFIHVFFQGIETGAISLPSFHTDWAEPTYKIVRFLVFVFAAIVIYPYLPGSDTAAFKGISVFLGVLISFGSSSAIANVVAGVVMTYMRPFQLGDRVKIADTVGDIVEKTLLITRVRTIKNVDITVPNAMVLSSHIINYSSTAKEGGLVLHTGVTIGYDVPWKQVHQLLIDAASRTGGVMKEPTPFVLQTSLDDFYVSYELNAYTDTPNIMARTYSELHQHIQDAFNEAGVEIMSPHYGAMRDGNQVTIPPSYLPKTYEAPAFRLFNLGGAKAGGSGPAGA
ncbi:MAG: mechanosensitive ion channel family protein [Gemmatimonadota bacterium]|nr:mechanosensitive ion channel family protein [Gemmatimonadota bacterium]